MLKEKPPKYTDFKQMGLFYPDSKVPFIIHGKMTLFQLS